MAKSSTRRVTIYINDKEVEASVKQIRSEMNKLVNEQNRMVIGSDEYISHAKKIRWQWFSKYSYFCAPVREMTNHYRLYHLQILADLIREDTCDTRRSMPACATTRGHRAMAPAGAGGRGLPLTYRAMAPAGAGWLQGAADLPGFGPCRGRQ